MTDLISQLESIKAAKGTPNASGLSEKQLKKFSTDPKLQSAVRKALQQDVIIREQYGDLVTLPEHELRKVLQEQIMNFYPETSVSVYVPLAAAGPWIVSLYGGVFYDTGGYGMLGHGHSPESIIDIMSGDYVMANVMTPCFAQQKFCELLTKRIGEKRGSCPYQKFAFLNSGSGAMAASMRISDLHARIQTDPGGTHEGKEIMLLGIEKGFHGRTYRPARASDSTREKYQSLASFRDRDDLLVVPANDVAALENVFESAEKDGVYIELMLMEPVMGEGNPGVGVTPEFYAKARELTEKNKTLLLMDSIQAGLRAHGVLSITDYPGFEKLDPPDMETFSKAVNAGQYPLSVIALRGEVADLYKPGLYGNTMTANPRAMEVGYAVLDQVTPAIEKNICERGKEFVEKLKQLQTQVPEDIISVNGTGLLVSAALREGLRVVGFGGVEEAMRKRGVNVIHGGPNSLRFTPWFHISSEEIDLLVDVTRDSIDAVKQS